MIDFKRACEKAILKEGVPTRVHTAWDFGDFFLFSLAPMDVKEGERYDTGTVFTAVDKKTGQLFEYDITSDLDAFDNAVVLV